jgi:hypothetical protein
MGHLPTVACLETQVAIQYQYENTISKANVPLSAPFSLTEQKQRHWKYGITLDGYHIIMKHTSKAEPVTII